MSPIVQIGFAAAFVFGLSLLVFGAFLIWDSWSDRRIIVRDRYRFTRR